MSDAVKWALAAAIVIGLIATIITFPFVSLLPESAIELGGYFSTLNDYAGNLFYQVRGLINMFLTSFGIKLLNVLIVYFFTSWIMKITVKITSWVFHFIFK